MPLKKAAMSENHQDFHSHLKLTFLPPVSTWPVLDPHSTGAAGPAELAVNCASRHSVRLLGALSVLTSELGWASEKLTKSSLI